jgi:FkbM family methyltransferase
MLKAAAKSILQRAGLLPIARLAYRRLNPSIVLQRRREIQLYRGLLAPGSLVFDVGANLGQKSDIFLSAGFRSIVIEPNLHCQESLTLQFANNPRATIVQKAVGREPGTALLYSAGSDAAASLLSGWNERIYGQTREIRSQVVTVTTLDNLIHEFGPPEYIKIDIEGFEKHALLGLSRSVPLISIEYHLHELDQARECVSIVSRLGRLSFRTTDMYGYWTTEHTDDLSRALSTDQSGDLYIWINS